MIKFGGYLSTPIETIGSFVEDINAFVFTFKDDIPLKCDILKSESFNAFSICSNSRGFRYLFQSNSFSVNEYLISILSSLLQIHPLCFQ